MSKFLAITLAFVSTVLAGFGGMYVKLGADKFNLSIKEQLKNFKLQIGLALYIVSSLIFIVALKLEELSLLYPITSLSYVWISFLSIKYLDEDMNNFKWFGILLIMIGVSLVTR